MNDPDPRGGRGRALRGLLASAGVAAALAVLAVGAAVRSTAVPSPADVRAAHRPSDVEIVDRNGVVVHELRDDAAQRSLAWVPLDAVSPLLRDAIVAAEDRRFAAHGGVDALALASAVRGRFQGATLRGASTITMQLASLLDRRDGRRDGRTLAAKWRQMRRAWALERTWTKDQILEAYLNLVPFRGEVSGVGAAAGVLLGKRPHGLAPAEAIVLAVLPRSPNADAGAVDARAARLAAGLGVAIEPARLDETTALALRADQGAPRIAIAPHLARRLLGARGGGPAASRASVVRSTLDAGLQQQAARLLEEQLRELRGRNVRDGAVLVVDNASGDVLAYVGGRGARATARHVDSVRARRQAGSTLKPFLYAAALDERLLTAASLLQDTPLAVPVAGGMYQPRNYDEGFRGLVSVRSALASSLNVPAVRTLELVSADVFVTRLRALGFGLERGAAFYGPALALGSAEVSLEELVDGYRALANGGVWSPLRLTPDDPRDETASGRGAAGTRVFSPQASFVVADVLSDRDSRSATFGLENTLATRAWAAVKTGTSKEMRDNWCVGFSRRYTVGVWVGNASGEPMHDVSGLTGAAPVWRELMGMLEGDASPGPPSPPDGLVRAVASFARGAEAPREEWFLRGTEPGAGGASLAPPRPRIASPQQGTILAIDPDIPRELQRLALEAHGVGHGGPAARWRLDDVDLGAASGIRLWNLVPGRHRLVLVAEDGRVLDAVAFEVRGGARAAAPAADEAAAGA